MLRKIYKLYFTTPVHFGTESGGDKLSSAAMTFRADTLFSALYLQGNGDELLNAVNCGRLWFSDAFPFSGEQLYLPKPMGIRNAANTLDDPSVRKLYKKLSYVPLSQLSAFMKGESSPERLQASFGTVFESVRVNRRDYDLPLPYQVAGFRFGDDCGLYLIVAAEDEGVSALFESRLRSLSAEGIGGKTSSGWGKFVFESLPVPRELEEGLLNDQAPCQLLLSTALPAEEETEQALRTGNWLLVRRGGFSFSLSENAHKKRTLYLLGSGSTFAARFRGQVVDVARSMPHPVWRCAMAGFMGVDA